MNMTPGDPSPPKYILKFFRWYCHPSLLPAIEGDLVELYRERAKVSGKRKADLNFLADVILLFRPGIIRPAEGHQTLNQYGMLKSYVKIGWRNLLKTKGYSAINIGGLAIGMASAILMGLWLHYELTFNQDFKNYDRIARVMKNEVFNSNIETWSTQPKQLGPELSDYYGANFSHVVRSGFPNGYKLTHETKSTRHNGTFMDPAVTEMLRLKMIKGTRDGLKDPHSILLSASVAKAIFGNDDPMDKLLKLDDKNDIKVTGIYEDLPLNSDFRSLGFIVPFDLFEKENLPPWLTWGNSWFQCYVELADGVDFETASLNIREASIRRIQESGETFRPELFLHPMDRWHLYYQFENGIEVGGGIRYVQMFGTIGFFVLLLACINFMNLSTARAERRAKEVGIRKTVGSRQGQLVNQFYIESFIVVSLAMVISVLLAQAAMPWFSSVSGKSINIPWTNPMFWITLVGFTLAVGFISGSYPAFYLSSFKPVRALKGVMKASRSAVLPRKVMVVLQFTISVILITGTFVVIKQVEFARNRPMGYNSDGLVSSPVRTDNIKLHVEAFCNDLRATGAVVNVSLTDIDITNTGTTNSGLFWKGKPDDMQEQFWTLRVTHDFGALAKWELVAGRDFLPGDSSGFIVNETAARYMDMKSPVGETIRWGKNGEFKIIGVVKDMITLSPYSPAKQMIFFIPQRTDWFRNANMRLNPEMSVVDAMEKVETVFKKYDPDNAFEYSFVSDRYAEKFNNEKRVAKLSSGLAGLGIFICCLGLFGLASYMAEQRTKEIGIRKVLGASVAGLWSMMSRDLVVLVVIAGVIAVPAAYYLSNDWLSQFEYRVPLSWYIFVMAIGGAFVIALLTVSYHALRAAFANPVKSLRSE